MGSTGFSAIAFSGFGVYSGFTQGGRNSKDIVPNYYHKAATVPYEEHNWDFSKVQNDLVVINLGTNDA